MPLSPAAIGMVLNEPHTHILLVKRRDVPVWVLPGGGIDDQETPEKAVRREVWEETGMKITIERQCAEYYPINRLTSRTFVFLCCVEAGQLQLTNETTAVQFHPLNQLPATLFFLHREWIEEGLNGSHLIKKPINQITYYTLLTYFLSHPLQVLRFAWTRFFKSES